MVDEPNSDNGDRRRSMGAEAEEGQWDDVHALHDPVMREHERPRDGFEPVSVWLILFFIGFAGWGGWYIGAYSAAFRADVIDIIPLEEQAVAPEAEEAEADEVDPMAMGEEVFSNCVPCHQADGQGLEGSFPPLVGSERVGGDPRPFAALLLHGLEGPLEVQGATYNNAMPGWAQLDDQEIAAVMTYVRQSWGNDAEPVEAELVGQVREATAERDEAWTNEELEQFDWQAVEAPPPATDAGQPDAGQPDAGQPDAEQPDAGQPDAGQTN
ncbi:MAG: c-type cytochrome [Persicimonas sp.]